MFYLLISSLCYDQFKTNSLYCFSPELIFDLSNARTLSISSATLSNNQRQWKNGKNIG